MVEHCTENAGVVSSTLTLAIFKFSRTFAGAARNQPPNPEHSGLPRPFEWFFSRLESHRGAERGNDLINSSNGYILNSLDHR